MSSKEEIASPAHAVRQLASTWSGSAEALLSARGVRYARGGRSLLNGVDLDLVRGELLTLVGPNGSGKSTLIKILCGVLRPDAGEIQRRPGLRSGYVPQRFQVDDNLPLTVDRFLRLQQSAAPERLEPVIAATGIARLMTRPLQALSGGESRRVLLARALLRAPDLLFLDEPAAGLDVNGQAEIYDLIQAVRAQWGCGVLVVSHDLHLVMAASDQVICLNEGRISCRGGPASVREHPEYRALFGHQVAPGIGVYSHGGHSHHEGH
jgi:zinc transport system ATP-binding protein